MRESQCVARYTEGESENYPPQIFVRIVIARNLENTIPAIHEPAHTRASEVRAYTDGGQPCFLSWAS